MRQPPTDVPGYLDVPKKWGAEKLALCRSALADAREKMATIDVAPCFATYITQKQQEFNLSDDEVASSADLSLVLVPILRVRPSLFCIMLLPLIQTPRTGFRKKLMMLSEERVHSFSMTWKICHY